MGDSSDYEAFFNNSDFEDPILGAVDNEEPTKEVEPEPPRPEHLRTLRRFGHSTFRPLQWKIISSIIKNKRDNCAIMATGYGKSLCFQYPSVFIGGLTLVISPLISLMEDQVLALQEKKIPACLLGMANMQQSKTIDQIFNNEYCLVYVTPEFCIGDNGLSILTEMYKKLSIRLIAIDEAHCVSVWGHDFRTSYQKLGTLRDIMPSVPILAVTATATPPVKKEIVKVLKLRNPQMSTSGLDRPNLYFAVRFKGYDVYTDIKKLMIHENYSYKFEGPTIIYTLTKNNADNISQQLEAKGIKCLSYHAGMSVTLRKQTQIKFINGEVDVIIATIAFGMGIDKANVRNVIHYGCPSSLEGYYQEAGRAGRDGLPSKCFIFYSEQDFNTHKFLRADLSKKSFEIKLELIEHMKKYLTTLECRRKFILTYFEGNAMKLDENKNCCDNCTEKRRAPDALQFEGVDDSGLYDFTEDVRMFLNSVKTLNYAYGMSTYIDFLRGCKKEKFSRYVNHPCYSAGKDKSIDWWKQIGKVCVQHKLLQIKQIRNKDFKYEGVEITENGRRFLVQDDKILQQPGPEICAFLKRKSNIWLSTDPSTSRSQSSSMADTQLKNTTTIVRESPKFLNPDDLDAKMKLVAELKEKRNLLAKEYNVPLFAVASDKALSCMASKKPVTLQQLRDDKYDRFTDEKIEKYGTEFIKIILGTVQKRTIKDILEEYPMEAYKINATNTSTYFLFKNGKSVKEIMTERNLKESTIVNHMIEFLKCGNPIKLGKLGVTEEIKNTISEAIRRNKPDCSQLNPIKNLCPEDITFDQIKLVLTYYRIREHLNRLGIPYEEFEDFEYQELKYISPEEATNDSDDDLTMLVDGLLEAQNYSVEKCEELLADKASSSTTKPIEEKGILKEIDQDKKYTDKETSCEHFETDICKKRNHNNQENRDVNVEYVNLLDNQDVRICEDPQNSQPNKKPKITKVETMMSPLNMDKIEENASSKDKETPDCMIVDDDEFDDILSQDSGKGVSQLIDSVSVLDSPPRRRVQIENKKRDIAKI